MGVTWCQQPPPARRTHRRLPRPTNAARADGRSGECYVRVGAGGARCCTLAVLRVRRLTAPPKEHRADVWQEWRGGGFALRARLVERVGRFCHTAVPGSGPWATQQTEAVVLNLEGLLLDELELCLGRTPARYTLRL